MEEIAIQMLAKIASRFTKKEVHSERTTIDDPKSKLGKYTFYELGNTHLACFSSKDMLVAADVETLIRELGDSRPHLFIVSLNPPSPNTLKAVRKHSKKATYFHIRELQFDITTHRLFAPHRVLSQEETTTFCEKFHVADVAKQLPWIDSHDPGAKWVGAVPGDVVEIHRHSDSTGKSLYYRYCVADVDVVTS